MATIYFIKNTVTEKYYIGETIDYPGRINHHFSDLRRHIHHSHKLQNAFDTYGEEAFEWGVIEEVDDDIRFDRESEIIAQYNSYNNGYNETSGGDCPGYEKLCKTVYCYNLDGTPKNISFPSGREASRVLGIHQSSVQKICKGEKKSARDKNGEWYRFSYENVECLPPLKYRNGKSKYVEQYDAEGNFIQMFDSAADVNRYFGIDPKGNKISQAASKGLMYKGYYWKYKE